MRSHSTRIWTQNTTRQLIFLILLRYPFSLRYDWTITVDVHFFRVYIVVAFAHSPGALRHYVDCRPQWYIQV